VITIGISERKPRVRRGWVGLCLIATVAASAAGCDQGGERHEHKFVEASPVDRGLSAVELDSMRSMKLTHRVSRDEFWDSRGGVIANDRVEVWYQHNRTGVIEAMAVLKFMDQAADSTGKTFGRIPSGRLVVVCAPSLESFRRKTGRDWWHYSLIKGDTMNIQTPLTLYSRGLLQVAARREYYTWAIGKLTGGKSPHWLLAGLASHFADERPILVGQRGEYAAQPLRMDIKEIEKELKHDDDRLPVRRAMYNAYLMVDHLVEKRGMPAVAAFALACGEESNTDAAAKRAFGASYDAILNEARAWSEPPAAPVAPAP